MTAAIARTRAPFSIADMGGESCTVAVKEGPASTTRWLCRLHACMPSGRAFVRQFTTVPRSFGGGPACRVVAVCTIPDCQGYELEAFAVAGGGARDEAEFSLDAQHLSGGAAGFELIDQTAKGRVYGYAAGVAGNVTVPPGALLMHWSAFGGVAATAQVGVGQLIPCPPLGAVTGDPMGSLVGPVSLTFIDTSGYFVEWEL